MQVRTGAWSVILCSRLTEHYNSVIFVHGLKGHPRKTWGPPKKDARDLASAQPSPSKWKAVQSFFHSKRATPSSISDVASESSQTNSSTVSSICASTSTSSSVSSSVFSSASASTSVTSPSSTSTTEKLFWPLEFLVEDVPQARIWTYGYNADVLAGMFQMNNKNSVSQHGRDLAARLERELDNDVGLGSLLEMIALNDHADCDRIP